MPLEYLHQRWHFHQRMNKKVWTNLERLKMILATNPSKQDILDALHPWRLAPILRFNNTFAIAQIGMSVLMFAISCFYFSAAPWFCALVWLMALALAVYAYLSFEKKSDIDQVIQQLTDQVFQDQYAVQFNQFPHIDAHMLNPTHMLMRVRQGFDCLNEGNVANNLNHFAATIWQVNGQDFPVLLFHYESITEAVTQDIKGNRITKQIRSDRWGACIFNLPPLAFMLSTTEKTYPRYPIKWSSSDIQFNRKFNLAGQQQLELARNLTPQRILALANNLDHLRGTLMFHDQMNACCYVSTQNIFSTGQPNKPITDISMLRGYLRTLHAPHYERMQTSLSEVIRHFQHQ